MSKTFLGVLVLSVSLFLAGPGVALARDNTGPAAAETSTKSRPARSSPSKVEQETNDYAKREAGSQSLETFKGGSSIVITSTALVVILLVVIILILI
jgi:hypothetical protein